MNFAVSLGQRARGILPNLVVQPRLVQGTAFKPTQTRGWGFEMTPKISMLSGRATKTVPTLETERAPEKSITLAATYPVNDTADRKGLSGVRRQDVVPEATTSPQKEVRDSPERQSGSTRIVSQKVTSLSPRELGVDSVSQESKQPGIETGPLPSGKGSELAATPGPDLSRAIHRSGQQKEDSPDGLPRRSEVRPAARSGAPWPAESPAAKDTQVLQRGKDAERLERGVQTKEPAAPGPSEVRPAVRSETRWLPERPPANDPQVILPEKKTGPLEQRVERELVVPVMTPRLSGPVESAAKPDHYPLIEPKPWPKASFSTEKASSLPPTERRMIQVRIGTIEVQAHTPSSQVPQPVPPQAVTSQGFDRYASIRHYHWQGWD